MGQARILRRVSENVLHALGNEHVHGFMHVERVHMVCTEERQNRNAAWHCSKEERPKLDTLTLRSTVRHMSLL